jgi:hypothetical protein
VPFGIECCTANITPHDPNFRFTLADIINGPTAISPPANTGFQYPDATFDIVVLTSV